MLSAHTLTRQVTDSSAAWLIQGELWDGVGCVCVWVHACGCLPSVLLNDSVTVPVMAQSILGNSGVVFRRHHNAPCDVTADISWTANSQSHRGMTSKASCQQDDSWCQTVRCWHEYKAAPTQKDHNNKYKHCSLFGCLPLCVSNLWGGCEHCHTKPWTW